MALPELIEAAVRSGRDQLASVTLERLVERTQASGTDWALGIETRSRALLAAGPGAEAFYPEAIAPSAVAMSRFTWLGPSWCMASGCAAKTVESTPASS